MSEPREGEHFATVRTAVRANIVESFRDIGGILRCETCRRTEALGDPGERVLTAGWPKCHGYTMRWWTQRQIDAGEMPE